MPLNQYGLTFSKVVILPHLVLINVLNVTDLSGLLLLVTGVEASDRSDVVIVNLVVVFDIVPLLFLVLLLLLGFLAHSVPLALDGFQIGVEALLLLHFVVIVHRLHVELKVTFFRVLRQHDVFGCPLIVVSQLLHFIVTCRSFFLL